MIGSFLGAHRLLAASLSLLLFSFSLEEALLLVGAHALELAVALLLLGLVAEQFSVLGAFCLDNLAHLLGLLFTSLTDTAHDFGTEVGAGNELVGHAKEVGEERNSVGVGVELQGKRETLLGNQIIETKDEISVGQHMTDLRILTSWGRPRACL